jgi:holo-[acyl-carrier protein] synthase
MPQSALRVGIDLVRVSDAQRALDCFGDRYLRRLFTPAEVADCFAERPHAAERLAARFAAKEAAIKVLRPADWLDFRSIEVRRAPEGWTELALHARAAELARTAGLGQFALSMSHDGEYATAVVVATSNPGEDAS